MAWEDVVDRLGQVAAGYTLGTLESDQADRTERARLVDRAVDLGARGIDYAPFFAAEDVRPGNANTLQTLQTQSGGRGALQDPFNQTIVREAAIRRASSEQSQDLLNVRLEATAEENRARQAAQAGRSIRELTVQQWTGVRSFINDEVQSVVEAEMPDAFREDPRDPTRRIPTTESMPTLQAIRRAVERRLPDFLPNDPSALQDTVRQIVQDIRPGIVMQPRTGWIMPWGNSRAFSFSDPDANAQRMLSPGAPGRGSGLVAPAEASTAVARTAGTLMQQYQQPILATAREYGLPPNLLAVQMAVENDTGGATRQGPQPGDGGSRAVGPMQVRPETFVETAARIDERRGITNPDANIRVGGAYMRQMLDMTEGHMGLALASYNWGPERVRNLVNRVARQNNGNASWGEVEARLPAETRGYIQRIGGALGGMSQDGSGFARMPVQAVTSPAGLDMGSIATTTPPRTGEIPQIAPTARDAGDLEILVSRLAQTGTNYVTSQRDLVVRRGAKDDFINNRAMRTVENGGWGQYREWVRDQLTRRLRSLN